MDNAFSLLEKLNEEHSLNACEWTALIAGQSDLLVDQAAIYAREWRHRFYGHDVYIRGLIECSNYCKNDCLYCGIRKSNPLVTRYRLTACELLSCCEEGYRLGFRTFVLQGGEDATHTDIWLTDVIEKIKSRWPDCAVTLSLGERSYESYKRLFEAGADRYLLRHETFNSTHYSSLHPAGLTAANRQQCLWQLREIGYQVGCGFMVGSPGQTPEYLAEDMMFIQELNPQMIGIGPFLPHKDTPFAGKHAGSLTQSLYLLSLLRIMLPKVLLPSTTALGTLSEEGRQLGILAGGNVIMPNLSPPTHRKDYSLYDNKVCFGIESAEGLNLLARQMESIGYRIVTVRGDSLNNS